MGDVGAEKPSYYWIEACVGHFHQSATGTAVVKETPRVLTVTLGLSTTP